MEMVLDGARRKKQGGRGNEMEKTPRDRPCEDYFEAETSRTAPYEN